MSARLYQFHTDSAQGMSLSFKNGWPFTEFMLHGTTLTFTRLDDDGPQKYSLSISADEYPDSSILTAHAKDTTFYVDKKVQDLLVQLREELISKQAEKEKEKEKERDKEREKEKAENESGEMYSRSASLESGDSDYKECMSGNGDDNAAAGSDDDDEEEYCIIQEIDDEMEDDHESAEPEKMNTQLAEDMDQVRFLYGDSSLSYRLLESLGEIDVELHIPVSFLYVDIAEAWNLDLDKPLTVKLHLSSVNYLDQKDPPKVHVFQPSKKEKFGVGSQLGKILETFMRENWKSLSNRGQQAASKSFSAPAELSSFTKNTDSEGAQADVFSRMNDEALAQIVEMGFSSEVSRNALVITHGNVQEAINLLITNPESCTELDMASQIPHSKPATAPSRQLSHPASIQKQNNRPMYGRYKSISTSATTPDIGGTSSTMDDLTLMPSSTLSGRNAKDPPSLENGFLVQIFRYTRQRIPTLNEYCVVCDEPHMFQNGAMLKPTVCSRDLCVFAFQTLGVMVDAADDIATGAEVFVLLMQMTIAASKSNRKTIIFDPYPSVVDPSNAQVLALNPKHRDFNKIQSVVDRLPSVEEMMRYSSSQLKRELDLRHRLAYPLLMWIITSNRSHIVKLPTDRQISCMKTPHQFLLLSSPPAKEAKFQEEKQKYGSTYAFHGSSIENWHSIIRQGLVVASGTNKQMNGAAYGSGIYLSPSISVSSGYSRLGSRGSRTPKSMPNSRFLTSDDITCIALCEVITSPELKKCSEIWVCPKDCHVCTRFFFVYEDGQVGDNSMHTQVEKYKTEILKAVSYQRQS
ncbi:protein mono-ADP-ribosyltransferase PARP6-like [Gigantopelta aegis]|uniref:protein mono-ADP-ribosyltransferase PARP6-like n=1 Tax=Gigantopelta aegis TaxID=1735272 RepID=UPI001B88BECF|nr:protein mono-ADP-ribosyltransferase PARP6-like [Gigantopelta aegis]